MDVDLDKHAWRVIYASMSIACFVTAADIVSSYQVPAELYPFLGIVVGAALARLSGVREIGPNAHS